MKRKIVSIILVVLALVLMTGTTFGATKNINYGKILLSAKQCSEAINSISTVAGSKIQNCINSINNTVGSNNQGSQNQQQKPALNDNSSNTTNTAASPAVNISLTDGSKTSQVVSLVNQERAKAGLGSLKSDSQLNKLAQLKAQDMAKNNYFSHTSPTYGSAFDMMKTYGVTYRTAGENIAKGQKTASAVMNGWMNSQGHRANILGSAYTGIGVGYATDSNGTTYWVQIFRG